MIPNTVQQFGLDAVYRIESAVQEYNKSVLLNLDQFSNALVSAGFEKQSVLTGFKFIPRRWEETGRGYFTFSYFIVREFDREKFQRIRSFLQNEQVRTKWERFLNEMETQLHGQRQLENVAEEIKRLTFSPDPDLETSPVSFHHSLLQLYSSVKVTGAIPAVLHKLLHDNRSTMMFLVKTVPQKSGGLPDLRITLINRRRVFNRQAEQPGTYSRYGQLFSYYVVRLFTEPDFDGDAIDAKQLAGNYILFVPVFDDILDRKGDVNFRGHFLGWLFLFLGKREGDEDTVSLPEKDLQQYSLRFLLASQSLAADVSNIWKHELLDHRPEDERFHVDFAKRLHLFRNVKRVGVSARPKLARHDIYRYNRSEHKLSLHTQEESLEFAAHGAMDRRLIVSVKLEKDFFLGTSSQKAFERDEYIKKFVIQLRDLYQEYKRQEELFKLKLDLQTAGEIQRRLLQTDHAINKIVSPRLRVAPHCEHAEELGGDFYYIDRVDYHEVDRPRILFVLGDPQDHGAQAALPMVIGWSQCRNRNYEVKDARQFVGHLNKIWQKLRLKTNLAIFCGLLDPEKGELQCCNAHIPNPYLIRGNTVKRITVARAWVGPTYESLVKSGGKTLQYTNETFDLIPGDKLLLFTDGLTDARRTGTKESFGPKRIESLLQRYHDLDPRKLRTKIIREVGSFSGGKKQVDDMTMIILQWLGPRGAPDTSTRYTQPENLKVPLL